MSLPNSPKLEDIILKNTKVIVILFTAHRIDSNQERMNMVLNLSFLGAEDSVEKVTCSNHVRVIIFCSPLSSLIEVQYF